MDALAPQTNMAGGSNELSWPKNAGLLFFHDTPDRFFPGVQIEVVWFPEGAAGDQRTLPDKPNSRSQRYRLAALGQRHLKAPRP